MFVKVYRYRIKPEKEQEYLEIQKAAENIYAQFVDKRSVHVKSMDDDSVWMEIHWYKDAKSYDQAIPIIDQQEEIQQLYQRFLDVLDSEEDIHEEDYLQMLNVQS